MADTESFRTIRKWDGSQHRAFEELCYQLRDPTPDGGELVKTGDPDGGLEWYVRFPDQRVEGWQAKYTWDIDSMLSGMERSLKSALKRHPKLDVMTFCIPQDLPDAGSGNRKSARDKFEDKKAKWQRDLEGAEKVEIGLIQGGELLERLARPDKRGAQWFFWKEQVFDPEWCAEKLEVTTTAAGERYTPELNVELPVAFAFDGLGRTPSFWERYRRVRGEVIQIAERVAIGLTRSDSLDDAEAGFPQELERWRREVRREYAGADQFPVSELKERTAQLRGAASTLYDAVRAAVDQAKEQQKETDEKRDQEANRHSAVLSGLRYETGRLLRALVRFRDFLEASAAEAADVRGLLLEGEAGQGKTHLLCDVAASAIHRNQPAVVLLGQTFTGRDPWRSVSQQLGLGDLGWELLTAGMAAAGEAANAPFLLCVDALNESAEPDAWASNLRPFRAAVNTPWIGVAASYRSSFEGIVLPSEGLDGLFAHVIHPGFAGRELEALQLFLGHFNIEQPRVPFLLPEFTNPLFLKLYCQGLSDAGLSAPPHGSAHLSDVFERYLEGRVTMVERRLSLDPTDQTPSSALAEFADRLGRRGSDYLPRDEAKGLFESFAPGHKWPDSLFQVLIDEGVLAADVFWEFQDDDYKQHQGVRFSYQRFSDHQVVAAVLEREIASATDKSSVVKGSEALQQWIKSAPPNWMRALSVQLPEKAGIELLDSAKWELDSSDLSDWRHALLDSLIVRARTAVTERSIELAREASKADRYLDERFVEVLLAVAPDPEHPLNANRLHQALWKHPMPRRDAGWGQLLYYSLFDRDSGAGRLLRWAAAGPYDGYSDEVLELAAIPLVWLLGSPNRQLRDYATKSLVQLLHPSLEVIKRLGTRFTGVNDPYILERLAVIAHGAVLRGGEAQPAMAGEILDTFQAAVCRDDVVPNFITRDAVRGMGEWCRKHGVIDEAAYAEVQPPYSSPRPGNPATAARLEEMYERRDYEQRPGKPYQGAGYGTLFSSILGGFGDFDRYVITPAVRHFTQFPLDEPFPDSEPEPSGPNRKRLRDFEESLTDAEKRLLSQDPIKFVEELSPAQAFEFRQALHPPKPQRLISYPSERAQRWIFQRVLALGWTPDLFAEFDERVGRTDSGRSEHKPERFGKKYQWIALREFVARLADNFHMCDDISETAETYKGPWQFYGRDIDPTLPPAPFAEDQSDADEPAAFGPTFPASDFGAWWVVAGPPMHRDNDITDNWVFKSDDLPSFRDLVCRVDSEGATWIPLRAYHTWDDDVPEDEDRYDRRRRHLWAHIYAWVVEADDAEPLVRSLAKRSLMGRWMPENGDVTDAAYLAEMPWAEAANQWPRDWQDISSRIGLASAPRALSAELGYMWEGNVLDASIDESVGAILPVDQLFQRGELSWVAGTTTWEAGGEVVARYVRALEAGGSQRALLVREQWLKGVLSRNVWSLVAGWLGERSFIGGHTIGRPEGWLETTATTSLREGTWRFGKVRHTEHRHVD